MRNDVSHLLEADSVSYPRFAALYNWLMGRTLVQRMFDPLRCEIAGQAWTWPHDAWHPWEEISPMWLWFKARYSEVRANVRFDHAA